MARRKKSAKPVLALWVMVGLFLVLLAGATVYVALLVGATGRTVSVPRRAMSAAEAPAVFGTVRGFSDSAIMVESKQPFREVITDELTRISAIGGAAFNLYGLRVGAIITATGNDLGGGRLAADAIVVIKNGTGEVARTAPPTEPVTTGPTNLLAPPADWKDWATMPPLVGWAGSDSKFLFALRGYDLGPPAVSVELYDREGKLAERLELDVPGYRQIRPKNDFLTPEAVERRLVGEGFAAGRQLTAPFTLVRNDGSRSTAITPSASSTWWLSPDKQWLLNVDILAGARFSLYGLTTRHIVE